jgi:hypothetical protein
MDRGRCCVIAWEVGMCSRVVKCFLVCRLRSL